MSPHFKYFVLWLSLFTSSQIAYAGGPGFVTKDVEGALFSESVEGESRISAPDVAIVSKRDSNGRPSIVRTPGGKDVRLRYDEKGRVNSFDIGREASIFVTFVEGSDRISKISISSELSAKTVVLEKPSSKSRRAVVGAKSDPLLGDDYYNQLMIEGMIDELLNPWGFGMEWDLLNLWVRTPDERNKCLEDCARRCNRGTAVATAVCAIGSLLSGPLAPAVGAACTVQIAFGSVMCSESCPNRCE